MELFDAIRKRRITREFSAKEVDFSCIESMIEAATLAPTCNHLKQWDFVVIDNKLTIGCLAQCVNNYSASYATPKNPYKDMCKYAFPRQRSMFEEAQYVILPILKENSLYNDTRSKH